MPPCAIGGFSQLFGELPTLPHWFELMATDNNSNSDGRRTSWIQSGHNADWVWCVKDFTSSCGQSPPLEVLELSLNVKPKLSTSPPCERDPLLLESRLSSSIHHPRIHRIRAKRDLSVFKVTRSSNDTLLAVRRLSNPLGMG